MKCPFCNIQLPEHDVCIGCHYKYIHTGCRGTTQGHSFIVEDYIVILNDKHTNIIFNKHNYVINELIPIEIFAAMTKKQMIEKIKIILAFQ